MGRIVLLLALVFTFIPMAVFLKSLDRLTSTWRSEWGALGLTFAAGASIWGQMEQDRLPMWAVLPQAAVVVAGLAVWRRQRARGLRESTFDNALTTEEQAQRTWQKYQDMLWRHPRLHGGLLAIFATLAGWAITRTPSALLAHRWSEGISLAIMSVLTSYLAWVRWAGIRRWPQHPIAQVLQRRRGQQ